MRLMRRRWWLTWAMPLCLGAQTVIAATPIPNPPTGLRITAASDQQISLSWELPADDSHGEIAAYNLFRCVEGQTACVPEWYVWLDARDGTAYADTGVISGTTYRYAVGSMRYLAGEPGEKSVWSNQVTALAESTPSPTEPSQGAAGPTGLRASAGGTEINLSWTAPSGLSVRGYNLLRCEQIGVPCTPAWLAWVTAGAGDPPPAPTAYTDSAARSGVTYRYAVEAKFGDDYLATPWSNQITARLNGQSESENSVGQPDGANLLTNGSFEQGNDGWDVWGGALVVGGAGTGADSALMATRLNGAEQTVTGLLPGTSYTLTGSGRVTGSNELTIGVKNHGGREVYMRFTGSDYVTKSLNFSTGDASTSATIYVYKHTGSEPGYGDDLILTGDSQHSPAPRDRTGTTDTSKPPGRTGSRYSLVWSDEFDGSGAVDASRWSFESGFTRNQELQWYQPENAYRENGILIIEGRRESFRNPRYDPSSIDWRKTRETVEYTSASLVSRESWRYAKIVVRAKVTNLSGTWPAIWTLGVSCEWPSNGEVDIMENYGGEILANFAWGSDARWTPHWDSWRTPVSRLGPGWSDDFHVWELDWNEDRMSIHLDGVLLNDRPLGETINGSAACAGENPFRQPHQLLLNLALGGTQGGNVNRLRFPTRYLVDYVRVYAAVEDTGQGPANEPVSSNPGSGNQNGQDGGTGSAGEPTGGGEPGGADGGGSDGTDKHIGPISPGPVWRGVDLSYVNELEDCGAVYRMDGEIRDPYEIFGESGANLLRLRLWHTPVWTNYSTLSDVRRSIRRAKALQMRVLLNFHFSDDWADAGKQVVPAAWADIGDTRELARSLYDYTFGVLTDLDSDGLAPDFVQIGNAIESEILQPDESSSTKAINWERNVELLNAAIRAVRNFSTHSQTNPLIMLHVAKPESVRWWFDAAFEAGILDFDIIGFNYYPQWSEVPFAELERIVSQIRQRYGKDVVVAETAYPWTFEGNDWAPNLAGYDALVEGYPASRDGQRRFNIDLTQAVLDGGGLGIVYWEPAWITTSCSTRWGQGSHAENQALFDYEHSELHEGATFLAHDYDTGREEGGTGGEFRTDFRNLRNAARAAFIRRASSGVSNGEPARVPGVL